MDARQALDELVLNKSFQNDMRSFAWRKLRDTDDMHDAIQAAIATAYGKADQIWYPERARGFLWIILERSVCAIIRKRVGSKVQQMDIEVMEEAFASTLPSPLSTLLEQERLGVALRAFQAQKFRSEAASQVARLIIQGKTRPEIRALGYSGMQEKCVRFRLKKNLRNWLKQSA